MRQKITSVEQLEALYGAPGEMSLKKEIDYISDSYKQFIEAAPFCVLSTYGAKGIDVTPRGDPAGFVRVVDEKTLLLPDRRGNNRLDNLHNIIENPQVGLIFLIPNVGETIRVAGRAEIIVDEALNDSFAIKGKAASSVLSITVDKIYFHCAKAIMRSGLWKAESHVDRKSLPSAGRMGKDIDKKFDADAYDKALPERYKKTLY